MIDFTDQSFEKEVIKNDTPVVVDFWAPWCGPCKMVAPIIEELSQEYEGKVKFGKVNVDENSEIASSFGIMSIPTLMVFKNGQPLKAMIGAQGKEAIKKGIEEVLAS